MSDPSVTMFASSSLGEHVLRGAIGLGALAGALQLGAPGASWIGVAGSLLLVGAALAAFRGCPVCWTIGLVETVAAAWRRPGPAGPARGGS